ncbi:A-kinase anchor protein 17A [Marmota marmota marmota]|uniref:A-kinase anchor protein 17A n=1 Tax=Marmota marmota marmota TaxID=9994 RepID=UPI002093DAF4|nr:A-kinase anchor protein 17A [Marmota marmota marmota]
MAAATIVHDTSEAVELCPSYGLYLKPITKMTISVALPQLKQPGKSISNWEVMERLKGMVQHHQFSTLRISKSTMDFIRFEGEVENRSLVRSFLACLDGKTIKLSGFSDILKVRAAEFKIDFPTRHDWDSFFRDAKDMNETLPGERPDTIHLEGLPCKWFAQKESGSEKPSEEVLVQVFEKFGEIRNVDIPMLDPYREEMTGRNFHTFSFGGHLNFEAYVQYREYVGFIQAMSALRGMKLMFKGDDGKAVACSIKVSFDSTKHLSDASIKKRQLERQKLQELERQREAQKRREKEAEERQRAEERFSSPPASWASSTCWPRPRGPWTWRPSPKAWAPAPGGQSCCWKPVCPCGCWTWTPAGGRPGTRTRSWPAPTSPAAAPRASAPCSGTWAAPGCPRPVLGSGCRVTLRGVGADPLSEPDQRRPAPRSPAERLQFTRGLQEIWSVDGRRVLTAFDLSPFHRICDLGGGAGALAQECACVYPGCHVTVLEVPEVVQTARAHLPLQTEGQVGFREGRCRGTRSWGRPGGAHVTWRTDPPGPLIPCHRKSPSPTFR